jgi:hypothetical protein
VRTLVYTPDDARRWAAFSGDYNPVHFDKTRGALSIHGMRALLDVKRFIEPAAPAAQWLKCMVRMRRPLWYGASYSLEADEKRAAAASVIDPAMAQTCLSCQLTAHHAADETAAASQSVLSVDDIAALERAFTPLLAQATRWQFLDALLFRHLIHDAALLRQDVIASCLPPGASLEKIFSQCQVVQTHQELVFHRSLLLPWQSGTFTHALKIDVLPALVVGDIKSGAVVRIAAAIREENMTISNAITLKIGLLAAN